MSEWYSGPTLREISREIRRDIQKMVAEEVRRELDRQRAKDAAREDRVERVAKALFSARNPGCHFGTAKPWIRDTYRSQARIAIAAMEVK